MASARDTATFFSHGTSLQFEHVLELYPQALRLKAERKAKKAEELIKLDNWFQNELPKKIKSRGRDAHLVHDELVQCMKWKQSRGKFYPQLSYLVKVNTPRMVIQETKKAFRKLPNLEQAITALSNLKGVGTTMASAVLAAASPELAPFMADECLMAIPEIEGIDYTIKEYLKFANHITNAVERLNKGKGKGEDAVTWSPHKVELAIWTHFIVTEMKPELLSNLPTANGKPPSTPVTHQNGDSLDGTSTTSDESNSGANGTDSSRNPLTANGDGGSVGMVDDDTTNTTNSYTEDSLDKQPGTPSGGGGGGGVAAVVVAGILNECDDVARDAVVVVAVNEETSDSILSDSASNTNDSVGGGKVGESVNKRPLSGDDEEAANDADDAAISCKRSRLDDTDSKEVVAAEDK